MNHEKMRRENTKASEKINFDEEAYTFLKTESEMSITQELNRRFTGFSDKTPDAQSADRIVFHLTGVENQP